MTTFNDPTVHDDYVIMTSEASEAERLAAIHRFETLLHNAPIQKYNGKPGCACGCNGTHVENPDAVTVRRTSKIIRRHLAEGTGEVMFGPTGTEFVWAETETTANALYWY